MLTSLFTLPKLRFGWTFSDGEYLTKTNELLALMGKLLFIVLLTLKTDPAEPNATKMKGKSLNEGAIQCVDNWHLSAVTLLFKILGKLFAFVW